MLYYWDCLTSNFFLMNSRSMARPSSARPAPPKIKKQQEDLEEQIARYNCLFLLILVINYFKNHKFKKEALACWLCWAEKQKCFVLLLQPFNKQTICKEGRWELSFLPAFVMIFYYKLMIRRPSKIKPLENMSFFMVNQFQASRIKVLRTGFLKKFKKYLYAGLLSVCFRVLVFFQKVPEFI